MKSKIGTVLPHNKKMQEFLRSNGFTFAVVKLIEKGSMRGTWRIYSASKRAKDANPLKCYDQWSIEIAEKLNGLGFRNFTGDPLGRFDGNGGLFSIFARHNSLYGAKIIQKKVKNISRI